MKVIIYRRIIIHTYILYQDQLLKTRFAIIQLLVEKLNNSITYFSHLLLNVSIIRRIKGIKKYFSARITYYLTQYT